MAQTAEISCIHRDDRANPYDRITHVGGVASDGTRWIITHQDAIALIENGTWTFFVSRPTGDAVLIIVARSPSGQAYLTTQQDGDSVETVLSLPECPP